MKKNVYCLLILTLALALLLVACGTTHQVSKTWKMDEANHWHICNDCDELFDKGAHDIKLTDEQTVTCTEDGYKKYTCSVCGYSYKDTTAHQGHNLEKHNASDADCVNNGNTEYYHCSVCQKYYSDAAATNEIAENSWVVNANGHQMTHVEGKPATITQVGNIEYYSCEVCQRNYADKNGTVEITESVEIAQLVASVAQAQNANLGDVLVVRGIVVGVTTTGASKLLQTSITLKDEKTNAVMALSGGVGTATKLSSALGSTKDLKLPYAKGTVIEIPVTVAMTNATYACGNAYVRYLDFIDSGEELESYKVGTAQNYAFDFSDESIIDVKTQSDFFKLLGLENGSNVSTSEGFKYSAEVAGANTYKLVRMTNLEGVLNSADTVEENFRYWRPVFGAEYDTWAKTSISNSAGKTNNIGAKQSFYPVFYNYNTFVNTGKTFSQLAFGDTSTVAAKDWKNHTKTDKTIYCLFIGGNDYYAHFVILDESWVVSSTV